MTNWLQQYSTGFCFTDIINPCQSKALSLMLILITLNSSFVHADSPSKRHFEYQQAAGYTHINWHETLNDKIAVKLNAIKNFSGIPMAHRQEKAEYFSYGKLPEVINNIYHDAFAATRYLVPTDSNADYSIEMFLEKYQLPYQYEPDDKWWQKLHALTDRWSLTPLDSSVKLTIKLSSANKKIKPWIESVEMVLSHCDLNAEPQAQTWQNNEDELTRIYLSTTPGQTFLAATNFLILKAMERINQQPLLARVERKFGDEIHLTSQSANFIQGEVLDLFYNHHTNGKSKLAAGQLKVIKVSQDSAISYPLNLKSTHINVGDWVEMKTAVHFEPPESHYVSTKSCAQVSSSEQI